MATPRDGRQLVVSSVIEWGEPICFDICLSCLIVYFLLETIDLDTTLNPAKRGCEALGQLDDGYCLILELRYVRDLSYREIADTLGITSSNAGVRINRALSLLRKALPQMVDASDCLRSISGPAVEARPQEKQRFLRHSETAGEEPRLIHRSTSQSSLPAPR